MFSKVLPHFFIKVVRVAETCLSCDDFKDRRIAFEKAKEI